MQFGAHETMELHEFFMEKISMITHFNLYAQLAKNPQLLDMIVRHQQEEIVAYNEIIGIAYGNNRFNPVPPNTQINEQIRYGLTNPPQYVPQFNSSLSDSDIAIGMLLCHKNAARNAIWAALECTDLNLRHALLNSSANCTKQAYEVFQFMNQYGLYQVPTFNPQTVETLVHSYQPASHFLEERYAIQTR